MFYKTCSDKLGLTFIGIWPEVIMKKKQNNDNKIGNNLYSSLTWNWLNKL